MLSSLGKFWVSHFTERSRRLWDKRHPGYRAADSRPASIVKIVKSDELQGNTHFRIVFDDAPVVVFAPIHQQKANYAVTDHETFFRALGHRVRALRKKVNYSQEDLISFGFSARHWQQIEAGRPITVKTLLRICDIYKVSMSELVRGLN